MTTRTALTFSVWTTTFVANPLAHARDAESPVTVPSTRPVATAESEPPHASLFRDSQDGAFDISGFLESRTGFLPVVIPITEPAVGYGAGIGLSFFHTKPRIVQTPEGPRVIPPNTTIVGGGLTENGTYAGFAAHLHTWDDGRIRYVIGGGFASMNLDWFGQGDAFGGRSFAYTIEAFALFQKLTFKLGDSDFFLGPTQRVLLTKTDFDGADNLPMQLGSFDILDDELDANVSGLGLTLGYDTRNSLFSPTRGMKGSLSYNQNGEVIGSDFNYGRLDAEVCYYLPLGGPFTLGLRGSGTYAGENAPFFDLAAVSLRGIQQGRYVDNIQLTIEGELRYDISKRWTLVGFGGTGWVSDQFDEIDDADAQWAAGGGFRYLIARKYDMRLGLDVARGEDDWAVYVTVGTGWMRD